MPRRFQVQPDKTINDPNGNRFRGVMVQICMNGVGVEHETAPGGNWAIRAANPLGVPVAAGKSPPTGNVPHTFRDYGYLSAMITEYAKRGVNGVRIGVDRAFLNTDPYTYNGKEYPADHTIVDSVVDICGRLGMLVNITVVCNYAPFAVKVACATAVADRYKNYGHVAINPSNEINCGLGTGTCANASVWASDMAALIAAIRGTGNKNLIIVNGIGIGDQSSSFDLRNLASTLSSAPFSTDPNLCVGIHHYRYIGSGSTGWNASDINLEHQEWAQYLSTFPIMIEETGIHTDVITNYDPEANEPGSSANLTEWTRAKAHWKGFLEYCRGLMDNDNLNGVCVLGDSFWDPAANWHSDLSVRRGDGSFTATGKIAFDALLTAAVVDPNPWTTVLTQNLPITGGSGINGTDFRQVIPGSVFPNNYTEMRVTIQGTPSYEVKFTDMFIGDRAVSGDVYDTVSMTRLKASGENSLHILAGGSVKVLDPLTRTGTAGKDVVFAFQVDPSSTTRSSANGPGLTGYHVAYKTGGVSSDTNPTGYTLDSGYTTFIKKIEVR